MPRALKIRRLLPWAAGLLLAAVVVLLFFRLTMAGLMVNLLLKSSGASQVNFNVVRASPWQVVVDDLSFSVRTQAFAAKRVTVDRRSWWMPSLGAVRVEQASVPLTIDGSDTNPWSWASYQNGGAVQPWQAPLDELSVDGQLVVKAAALPDQVLEVKFAARQSAQKTWEGIVRADGPGLSLRGEGSYDPGRDDLAFKVPAAELDLKVWQDFVRRLVLLPGGAWELEGRFTGQAEGRLAGKKLTTTGSVRLRDGRAKNAALAVTAEGIEAGLEFTDLAGLVSQPGAVRVRELRAGQLALREVDAGLALGGPDKITVQRASFQTLGGAVAVEPFNYFPSQREAELVVLVDGIDIAAVLALTQDLPARATGRVNGRFPLRIDAGGLRLGTGWLQLKPGVYAEMQFDATGLLTRGASASSPGYAVLKKVESGLLKLKITEMRLDIRPPNAPPGRSATLHIAGEPVDPDVKAPVVLDLNVNGPLEKLLNLGLDSRVSFGSKP
ncbi:MAG: YdbH domain-containing protein [Opitutae bacterium]|nr:YdbH domain-containing protein [Opitutae bacterium]